MMDDDDGNPIVPAVMVPVVNVLHQGVANAEPGTFTFFFFNFVLS